MDRVEDPLVDARDHRVETAGLLHAVIEAAGRRLFEQDHAG